MIVYMREFDFLSKRARWTNFLIRLIYPFIHNNNPFLEGYVPAEVKNAAGDDITVVTSRGNEQTLKKDMVQGKLNLNIT
jgi:hypothetical protein